MPERKWIHRSRNGKPWSPKSLNKVIEPSLERTAGQAPLSRVVVVEVLILLFVVVELVLVVEPVLVKLVLVVLIKVFVIVVEVLVVLVVLFLFLFLFLLDFGVVLRVHEILLVFDPWPITEPRHERLLRTV